MFIHHHCDLPKLLCSRYNESLLLSEPMRVPDKQKHEPHFWTLFILENSQCNPRAQSLRAHSVSIHCTQYRLH